MEVLRRLDGGAAPAGWGTSCRALAVEVLRQSSNGMYGRIEADRAAIVAELVEFGQAG